MLTDRDVEDWSERWLSGRPLRNLTQPQWIEIAKTLPPGDKPSLEALLEFLTAVNNYWDGAAGPPRDCDAGCLSGNFIVGTFQVMSGADPGSRFGQESESTLYTG